MRKFRRDVDHKLQVLVQSVSPGLVTGMPVLLRVLSMVGTAAML
jgi:predicted DNA repair protein MutK